MSSVAAPSRVSDQIVGELLWRSSVKPRYIPEPGRSAGIASQKEVALPFLSSNFHLGLRRRAKALLKRAMQSKPDTKRPFELCFIIGAQRSGTTWLQMLCAAHPKMAGGEESHIFSKYLPPIVQTYYDQLADSSDRSRAQGLPCYLTTNDFNDVCRTFVYGALGKLFQQKPGATMLVEKTPDHCLHIGFIRQLFPDAKMIHIIRDPRDVVISQRWVKWVTRGREWRFEKNPYLEVRYEALKKDGARLLEQVYRFVGLPLPENGAEQIYKQFSLADCAAGRAPNVMIRCGAVGFDAQTATKPEGFFRSSDPKSAKVTLSDEDLETVERICAPLMKELGYPLRAAATV